MNLSDDFPLMLEREAGLREDQPQVAVAFGLYPMEDEGKTREAGHAVYKDVEFVKIVVPGDRHSLYFQPATDVHKRRFPKAYDAYKQREAKGRGEGMPIEEWAPISRSLALTMKAAHIHTVEALAEVHEGLIGQFGFNARELREKARAWLADAKKGAEAQTLAAEKQALQDQIAALQAQMKGLLDLVPADAKAKAKAAAAQQVTASAPVDTTADVEKDVVAAARRPRSKAA